VGLVAASGCSQKESDLLEPTSRATTKPDKPSNTMVGPTGLSKAELQAVIKAGKGDAVQTKKELLQKQKEKLKLKIEQNKAAGG
jgi:hypothetical protein